MTRVLIVATTGHHVRLAGRVGFVVDPFAEEVDITSGTERAIAGSLMWF